LTATPKIGPSTAASPRGLRQSKEIPTVAIDVSAPRSRRGLLTALVAGVAGAAAATLTGAQRVLGAGDDGQVIHVGDDFENAQTATVLINKTTEEYVFEASNRRGGAAIAGFGSGVNSGGGNGVGLEGWSDAGTGVYAHVGNPGINSPGFAAAVLGEVKLPTSVSILGNNYATTGFAQGVAGSTNSPTGIATTGWANANGTAVAGISGPTFPVNRVPARTGVYGFAAQGRGGVFDAPVAQIRLVPAGAATHPSNGAVGDLFLDGNHRLWFCKGGATWKQIA
jgi:hypothetical protein